jgi:lambda family phage tail tape measure protein
MSGENMASQSLGTLTLDLIAKIGGFTGPLDKASRESQKRMAEISKAAKSAGSALGVGIGAGASIAAAALTAMVARQLDVIGDQADMAVRLRTTTESLGTLTRAAELSGIGLEQLESAGQKLEVSLGKAAQGSKVQVQAFDRLGLSYESVAAMPLDERISTINEALAKNIPVAERAAVAATLFGAKNAAAIQMLDSETLAEASRQVEIFGIKLSAVDSAKVEMAGDALSNFSLLADGIGKQLTVELAPVLTAMGNQFLESAEKAGGLGKVVPDAVQKAVSAIAFLASAADGVKRVFDLAADGIVVAFSGVQLAIAETFGFLLKAQDKLPGIDNSAQIASLEQYAKDAKGIIDGAQEHIEETLNKPLAGEAIKQFYEQAQKAGQAAAEAAAAAGDATTSGQGTGADYAKAAEAAKASAAAAAKEAEAINGQISALERAAKVWGMSADEVLVYDLRVKGATDSQLEYAKSLLETVSSLEKQKKAQEAISTLEKSLSASRGSESRQYGDELAGIGLSDKAQERLRSQRALIADYQDQINQAAQMRAAGDIDDQGYEKQLELYRDHLEQRIDMQQDYYAQLDEAQSDWTLGAKSAYENYLESAKDVAGQTKSLFENAFGGMEDAIVQFATTGKLSFSDFAKSVLADMARIAARQAATGILSSAVSTVAGLWTGGATSAGSTTAGYSSTYFPQAKGGAWADGIQMFAKGGAFTNSIVSQPTLFPFANGTGLMGEAGPEAIMPLTRGSDGSLGVRAKLDGVVGGGTQINVEVNISSDGTSQVSSDDATANQFGREIGAFVEQKYRELLSRDLRRDGAIGRAING